MPQIYCSGCKKSTPHKVVMRRCKTSQDASFSGHWNQFAQLLGKFVSGDHYYEMEPQHFCRCCNQKASGAKSSKRELANVVAQH